jgi:hypothetical protein
MGKLQRTGQWLKHQTKLLVAITLAAMVGGVTSAVVMASVPDQNGVIHTCYRNTVLQKTFRVIDSPSETCNTNETHLSWNQSGQSGGPQVAYIGVKEDGMLDTDYSQNISNYTLVPKAGGPEGYFHVCFTTNFTPKFSWHTGGTGGPRFSAEHPEIAAIILENCGSSIYNAMEETNNVDYDGNPEPYATVRGVLIN